MARKTIHITLISIFAFLVPGHVVFAAQHTVPLFASASSAGGQQGLLRIISHSAESGIVSIVAINDAGQRSGPVTFTLDARESVELSATDLEMGNTEKGLRGEVGSASSGNWRLEIDAGLDIETLTYARAADGFLASMHDVVRDDGMSYRVAKFFPGSNLSQRSQLRLINPGDGDAGVTISALDDSGTSASGGDVTLTLPAGQALTLTAQQLETGESGFTGNFGTGVGNWQLLVSTDRSIVVMNLMANVTGRLANLSTSRLFGDAPPDEAAFNARFTGKAIGTMSNGIASTASVHFLAGNRFTSSDTSTNPSDMGGYTYHYIGRNSGALTFDYDDDVRCVFQLEFSSETAGSFVFSCPGSTNGNGSWLSGVWLVEEDEEDSESMGFAPADQTAFDTLVAGKRIASGDPLYYTDFISAGRFSEVEDTDTYTGSYTFEKTGANSGRVEFNYDDGDRCTSIVTFGSSTTGTGSYSCNDGETGTSSWQLVDIPEETSEETTGTDSSVTYERLTLLQVSPGRVQFSFFSAGGCITLGNTTINGVTYSIVSSKWQTRTDSGSAWSDVADTARTGRLCSLNPTASGEYRLVAQITIGGTTGNYSSNIMTI